MEDLIRSLSPDCIFSDMFFPWTVDLTEELKITRLHFFVSNIFCHCIGHSLKVNRPQDNVESETESFLIPDLPDKIKMNECQLEDFRKTTTPFGEMLKVMNEAEDRSFGIVDDTFYEVEPAYVDYYKNVMCKNSYQIGPLFHFSNRDKAQLSSDSTSEDHTSLSWLDAQKPNSVLYVGFGSLVRFSPAQLTEIALALEASNHPFIWVVRKRMDDLEESWLPEGFEAKKQGIIIRNWAPQMKIMNHPAIGGFMTQCGWNSFQEATVAGVPLITWPLIADQFYTEKLIIELLRMGVAAGSEEWNNLFVISTPVVVKEKIEKAINRLMSDTEEADKIRRQVKEVSMMAKRAVQEGGSSYNNLTGLIEDIKAFSVKK